MSKKTAAEAPKNPSPDPAAAKKAFVAMSPRMSALAKGDLALLNIDGRDAAIIALTVSRFLAEPETRARFALLHAKTFNPAHLGDLATIALTVSMRMSSSRRPARRRRRPCCRSSSSTTRPR